MVSIRHDPTGPVRVMSDNISVGCFRARHAVPLHFYFSGTKIRRIRRRVLKSTVFAPSSPIYRKIHKNLGISEKTQDLNHHLFKLFQQRRGHIKGEPLGSPLKKFGCAPPRPEGDEGGRLSLEGRPKSRILQGSPSLAGIYEADLAGSPWVTEVRAKREPRSPSLALEFARRIWRKAVVFSQIWRVNTKKGNHEMVAF